MGTANLKEMQEINNSAALPSLEATFATREHAEQPMNPSDVWVQELDISHPTASRCHDRFGICTTLPASGPEAPKRCVRLQVLGSGSKAQHPAAASSRVPSSGPQQPTRGANEELSGINTSLCSLLQPQAGSRSRVEAPQAPSQHHSASSPSQRAAQGCRSAILNIYLPACVCLLIYGPAGPRNLG